MAAWEREEIAERVAASSLRVVAASPASKQSLLAAFLEGVGHRFRPSASASPSDQEPAFRGAVGPRLMPPTEFFAFDLLISRPWTGRRSYRAHLVRSPAGEAKGKLRWPRRAVLVQLLAALGQPGGAALGAALLGSRAASRVVRDMVKAREQQGPLRTPP
jgi:hypothetical protein